MENKKRLIDADALKKAICYKCNDEYSDEPCEPSNCVFCNAISDAPTVDAVEVVRCKDCIRYKNDVACSKHSRGSCEFDNERKPRNHFCSYGERKDGQ